MTNPTGDHHTRDLNHLRRIAIVRHGLIRADEDILTGTTPTKINQQATRLAEITTNKEHQ